MGAISWLLENGPALIHGVMGICSAVIVVALIIPGEQPEKALKSAVEFLAKFSRK